MNLIPLLIILLKLKILTKIRLSIKVSLLTLMLNHTLSISKLMSSSTRHRRSSQCSRMTILRISVTKDKQKRVQKERAQMKRLKTILHQ
jgi:hypothetical protein